MTEKVVVLCSGGFDSVTLAHRLRNIYPDIEIYALFFDYGQPNIEMELACASKCCVDIGATFRYLELLPFEWTQQKFYEKSVNSKEQYVEYRNLVFLSYAVSCAEAWGCNKIFMATHYFPNGDGMKDTDMNFIENFNKVIAPSNIRVETPFAWVYKEDLANMASEYGLQQGIDFFSCNCPTKDNEPCGECADCRVLSEMGF